MKTENDEIWYKKCLDWLGLAIMMKNSKKKSDNFCKFFQTNFERDNSHSRSMSRAVYKIQFKYTYRI